MDVHHFHLLKRGLDHVQQRLPKDGDKPIELKIPAWGMALLIVTFLVYMLLSVAIRYSWGNVVATLAMVETPTATAIVQTPPQESEYSDAPLLDPDHKGPMDQEILLFKTKPITAKIRTTIHHLRQRAGIWSRFRGAHIAMINAAVFHAISGLGASILPKSFIFRALIHVVVSVLVARLSMVWVHHVISEPSEKRWINRIAPRKTFRKIVGPTAVLALAEQVTLMVPAIISKHFHLKQFFMPQDETRVETNPLVVFGVSVAILLSVFVLTITLVLPLRVAVTRVYGSLLAEEEEPIVPFDRTYGGKVIPEIVGGSGKLEMRDAWKTFDWNARIRLVKIYIKTFAMQFLLFVLFTAVILLDVRLIMGKKVDHIVAAIAKGRGELKL